MELPGNAFIPARRNGKQLDLEHTVTKPSVPEAGSLYKTACKRLLHPFLWHELSGNGTAQFNIYQKDTDSPEPVEIDDHLFIDIPGLLKSENHDWVIVEDIKQNVVEQADESIGLKLRACANPGSTDENTNHFLTDSATSTLIIKRIANAVTASYHGRNEKPNIETDDVITNIRNGAVALGAIIGVSKLQWNALINGLLSD